MKYLHSFFNFYPLVFCASLLVIIHDLKVWRQNLSIVFYTFNCWGLRICTDFFLFFYCCSIPTLIPPLYIPCPHFPKYLYSTRFRVLFFHQLVQSASCISTEPQLEMLSYFSYRCSYQTFTLVSKRLGNNDCSRNERGNIPGKGKNKGSLLTRRKKSACEVATWKYLSFYFKICISIDGIKSNNEMIR